MTNSKTITSDEFLSTALAYAELFLYESLRYGPYASHAVVSVDSRWTRASTWHPVLWPSDSDAMTSADTFNVAVRVMASLSWQHDWAQVLLGVEDSSPVVLTWHNGEWQYGDHLL